MLRSLTFLVLLAVATSCASWHSTSASSSDGANTAATGSPAPPPLQVARATQFTETYELLVDGEHVGYVTEFLDVPIGTRDSRPLPTGSLMVEDLDFRWLGYVLPSDEAFTFDDRNRIEPVDAKTRDAQLTAIIGVPGTAVVLAPTFTRS